jgi:hypothetical protein
MDTIGYQDAEQFADGLREALHLKASAPAVGTGESQELTEARRALGAHTFPQLQHTNPKLAAAGLRQLVTQLGVFQEHEIDPTVALLRGAGDSAIRRHGGPLPRRADRRLSRSADLTPRTTHRGAPAIRSLGASQRAATRAGTVDKMVAKPQIVRLPFSHKGRRGRGMRGLN